MSLTTPASRAVAALLLLATLWGYNWVVMKQTLAFIGPFQFGALRTFLAAVLLMLILWLLKRPLTIGRRLNVAVIGVLQTSGFTGLIIWALVEGGAGKVAVLTYTMPFWVMLLAWPMLGEKLRGMQWLAALSSVAGLICILEPWHVHGSLMSNALAVMAGVSWALAVVLAKKLHHQEPDMDLLAFTAWQMLVGSLPLVAAGLLIPAPPIQWTPYLIGGLTYNVVACNALAWLLWLFALQRLPAGVASMISLLAPVIGVLAAWVELAEVPSRLELIGMILIASALAIIAIHSMRKHEEVDPAIGQE
ncbi:putative cystine transporter YijE [Anaerolineae bacterium]|nr:putative cystine transporter YijE [Anaerolineae bacterium]